MQELYIVAAKRTVQGKFLGGLSKFSAVELGVLAADDLINEDENYIKAIDHVIIGNVLSAGLGMNVARQISINMGLDESVPAFTINAMCASGLQSVRVACQTIMAGDASVVLCGGVESMTQAPYILDRARKGLKLGNGKIIDSLLSDGLVDAFDGEHMGLTAERIANEFNISRDSQDEFALSSQLKAETAITGGIFDAETIPVGSVSQDEHVRMGIAIEDLTKLKPVFEKTGTVTAGNASGINDGAAMLVVCNREALGKYGWTPMAKIGYSVLVGCDPKLMGLGPIHAVEAVLGKSGTVINDYEQVELNEAFAAQAIACQQKLKVSNTQLNPHGGAIALGHPIGASGARLAVHLAHQCQQGNVNHTLASLCVGGGMGVAMQISKV